MNISPKAWAAVLHLQRKQHTCVPMSFEDEVYDKALEFAIQRIDTHEPNYLGHNCYRHAKTHVVRTNTRLVPLDESESFTRGSHNFKLFGKMKF